MAIPSKQIGQPASTKPALLWQISKQLQELTGVLSKVTVSPITNGWSVVTGGVAGDGTVAEYATNGFNITGPNDGNNDGWAYVKKYYSQETELSIDYEWASSDEGIGVDWPIYCLDENEPTGIPSDLTKRVNNTPETGTWTVTVPAGSWFSVGVYSDDSCCGRGFLSVFVQETVIAPWAFVPGEISVFPSSSTDYTLYDGPWTNYDDGQTTNTFPLAGEFYYDGVADSTSYMSTNGYMILTNSGGNIDGNRGDLFLTPNDPLDDGDTQNFWYKNYIGPNKWRTSMLIYCGLYGDQSIPYSYVLNIYRDGSYQYIEACAKTNVTGDGNGAGPAGYDTQVASTATQVWRSGSGGNDWTYLGFGSVQ